MSTTLALTWETRRLLEQNERSEQNTLSGAYTAGGTSLSFSEAMRSIIDGAELEVDTELFRVTAVSGSTATVKGAQRGTTAANHSSGANVLVNPRFSTFGIISDFNSVLSELEAEGLYKETSIDITFNPTVSGYDLTGSSTVLEVLSVTYKDSGPEKRQAPIRSWSLRTGLSTSDFASGNALIIDSGGHPGLPLRVTYAAPFTRISALADDIQSTVGLLRNAEDLLPLGAAIRGMQTRDTRRSFLESQRDTRRSNEVPVGASQNSISTLRKKYEERIGQERIRMLQRYPYMNRRAR